MQSGKLIARLRWPWLPLLLLIASALGVLVTAILVVIYGDAQSPAAGIAHTQSSANFDKNSEDAAVFFDAGAYTAHKFRTRAHDDASQSVAVPSAIASELLLYHVHGPKCE